MAKRKSKRERTIPVVEDLEGGLDRLTPEDRGVAFAANLVEPAHDKKPSQAAGNGLVPMEVGVALMTGRDTFLQSLRTQVEQGRVIPKEQVLGMIDLVSQTIREWQAFQARLGDFQGWMQDMLARTGELESVGSKLAGYFRDLRRSGTKKLSGLIDGQAFQPDKK